MLNSPNVRTDPLFFIVNLFCFQSCSRCLSFWSKYVQQKNRRNIFSIRFKCRQPQWMYERGSYCFSTAHCCCAPSFGCVSRAFVFEHDERVFFQRYFVVLLLPCRNSPIELITFGHLTIALISHLHYGVPCTNKWMLCPIPDQNNRIGAC